MDKIWSLCFVALLYKTYYEPYIWAIHMVQTYGLPQWHYLEEPIFTVRSENWIPFSLVRANAWSATRLALFTCREVLEISRWDKPCSHLLPLCKHLFSSEYLIVGVQVRAQTKQCPVALVATLFLKITSRATQESSCKPMLLSFFPLNLFCSCEYSIIFSHPCCFELCVSNCCTTGLCVRYKLNWYTHIQQDKRRVSPMHAV